MLANLKFNNLNPENHIFLLRRSKRRLAYNKVAMLLALNSLNLYGSILFTNLFNRLIIKKLLRKKRSKLLNKLLYTKQPMMIKNTAKNIDNVSLISSLQKFSRIGCKYSLAQAITALQHGSCTGMYQQISVLGSIELENNQLIRFIIKKNLSHQLKLVRAGLKKQKPQFIRLYRRGKKSSKFRLYTLKDRIARRVALKKMSKSLFKRRDRYFQTPGVRNNAHRYKPFVYFSYLLGNDFSKNDYMHDTDNFKDINNYIWLRPNLVYKLADNVYADAPCLLGHFVAGLLCEQYLGRSTYKSLLVNITVSNNLKFTEFLLLFKKQADLTFYRMHHLLGK